MPFRLYSTRLATGFFSLRTPPRGFFTLKADQVLTFNEGGRWLTLFVWPRIGMYRMYLFGRVFCRGRRHAV